jgi:hypothetical protein
MSVAGHVLDYANDFVAELGKSVITYKDVVLDEICNTTRPAWYPSFGTVLAKSITEASDDATIGDNHMGKLADGDLLDETVVEDATKSEDVVETTDEDTTSKADEAEESTDEATEKSAETAEDTTEKAGRKVSGATAAELLGAFNTIQSALTNIGVLAAPESAETSEKSASGTEEDTTEKTEEDASTDVVITKADLDVLAAALEKANERIAELEARPATETPGLITDETHKAAADELAEALAKASPSDKMRLAFAAHTSGK